jgi:hypothetical protein
MSTPELLPKGTRGFDLNQPVKSDLARRFHSAGYRFVLRYVPRLQPKSHDLTAAELETLHECGFAVMPVQHVLSETKWQPSADLGRRYGAYAGEYCSMIGVAKATNVWLDLEGVDQDIPSSVVIEYCNIWHDQVAEAGYKPGVYVGWNPGINARDLYYRLRMSAYWGAYNLNRDQQPVVRSIMMKQKLANRAERTLVGFDPFNVDLVVGDLLGDLPLADTPENWSLT